jgi:hypothetical protein
MKLEVVTVLHDTQASEFSNGSWSPAKMEIPLLIRKWEKTVYCMISCRPGGAVIHGRGFPHAMVGVSLICGFNPICYVLLRK